MPSAHFHASNRNTMDALRTSRVPLTTSLSHNSVARLQRLVETGLELSSARDPATLAQAAICAAREIAGAEFGVYFYGVTDRDNRLAQHFRVSPQQASAADLASTNFKLSGNAVFRSADIEQEAEMKAQRWFEGTPFAGHLLRSLLAVPVRDRTGFSLGVILLGHSDANHFDEAAESDIITLAAQAAAALPNVHIAEAARRADFAAGDATRRAENAADDATRRLTQALDAAELGTWTWDRATDLLDLDERSAELCDTPGAHVPISRSDLRKRIVHTEDLALTASDMHDALSQKHGYSAEFRIKDRSGHIIWIASHGMACYAEEDADLPLADREIVGMIGILQDITARKTQEAILCQSEKLAATGRLAATIAHEINNPLEAVTNLIYLAKTDPAVPTAVQQLLNTADNELQRVSQIAQQTLGFYRDTTRPVDIDISAMLLAVVNLFSRKMEYKHIVCQLDIQPGLHIVGLQGEVRQVFSNLLVNAIDASLRTTIRIRAHARTISGKPGIVVLLSDRGSGIPEDVREKLFVPFFTTKQSVGTGLGLWVTRGIV
ncbi:MAG: ATP-binding protein, partial [Bryocella sp.]